MNRAMKRVALIVLGLVLLGGAVSSYAQSGGGYDLTWNTIDNGGGVIGNGAYTLDSTIGQSEASTPLSNGEYTLVGGFWTGVSTAQYHIYLPVVSRN